MEERGVVALIVAILVVAGLFSMYIFLFYADFNFYKSEINVNNSEIKEKLFFTPDKDYHTLYRNFITPLSLSENSNAGYTDYIEINSVSCKEGKAYMKGDNLLYGFPEKTPIGLSYTEPNEYGCGFGLEKGFKQGKDYWVESVYALHPENLFKIDGKYYIKFVIYSEGRHKFLVRGKNFFINQDIKTRVLYFPKDEVTAYIPYEGDLSEFKIIEAEPLGYSFRGEELFMLILCLLPAAMFFVSWHFFGRERTLPELPEQMSFYPRERKGWEVAVIFNPPLLSMGQNLFPAIMMDLYRRKLLEFKDKTEGLYIKIKEGSIKKLDNVESAFLDMLRLIIKKSKDKYKEEGYCDIKKALSAFDTKQEVQKDYTALGSLIRKEGKKYIDAKGLSILGIFIAIILGAFVIFSIIIESPQVILSFFPLFVVFLSIFLITTFNSAILVRFKEELYREYKHWQAFKNYLSGSFAMKESGTKAVVLWEQYLVYASALGVAKKVLKRLRQLKIIDQRQYNFYTGIGSVSHSFTAATVTSGGGGGGGGMGGGVGGGGGGGR